MRTLIGFLLTIAVLSAPWLAADETAPAKATGPQYSEQGELIRPQGWERWVYVGTDLGLGYRSDLAESPRRANAAKTQKSEKSDAPRRQDFHNVYIDPVAYEAFLKTGKFPDKTMLVMTVHEAKEKDEGEIVSRGLFSGKQRAVEVSVKDTNRPDGSKTDWAYYAFPGNQQTAKAFPDAACYDCHLAHADVDNVWVQFYPILRDRADLSKASAASDAK